MAATPTPVPLSPQFGVGLFQPNQTFHGLAGYRWAYPTTFVPVFGILDASAQNGALSAGSTTAGGVILPAGVFTTAGEQGLTNATKGMTNTQYAQTLPLIQHAQVLEGIGAAIEAGAVATLDTRKAISRKTAPRTIIRYVKPNVKAITLPLTRRADAADRRAKAAEHEIARLKTQVRKLQRQTTHDSIVAIPGLEADIEKLKRWRRAAEKELGKLGKWAGIGAFLLLLSRALEKIGANYIRCPRMRQWGNTICGMHPDLLASLLAESALLASGISLRTLTNQVLSVEGEIVAGVQKYVRELAGVRPIAEGGFTGTADGRT